VGRSGVNDPAPSWALGLETLRDRQTRLPALLGSALGARAELPRLDREGIRAVVSTGVGSSLAHARWLAWLCRERCGLPAWDAPTGAWLRPPPPSSREQALVVFSQGLSPNARLPLAYAEHYGLTVLVTAADADASDRATVVREARDRGVIVVPLGCPPEYQVLLRMIGPMLGYAVALRLANASGAGIRIVPDDVEAAVSSAAERMRAVLAGAAPRVLADPITLVGTDGYAALAHNLASKVQEGMYLAWPAAIDALELAHGTVQEATGKPRTFVALARGAPNERELFARARACLESHHVWVEAEARLPEPLAIFEHEAMMNELVLAAIAARRLDQQEWPGKGRDAALYAIGRAEDLAHPVTKLPAVAAAGARSRRLADLTWPEIEQRIDAGARTVVIPLGATEQHGPHLPLDVDAVVAEALAERFCARIPEALQAPAITLGCSVEHLDFPGTLSISPATLAAVLGDLVHSLVKHGFDHVVVFSAHGGNDAPLAEAEGTLRDVAKPATLTVVRGIERVSALWQAASAREGVSAMASGHHAGEFETSIIAAIRPDAIRWNELRLGTDGEVPDPQVLFYPSLRPNAPEGVVGDPRQASPERAERYLAAWTELIVAEYRAARP
jgi:creatinine amidohydrolase